MFSYMKLIGKRSSVKFLSKVDEDDHDVDISL